MKKLPLHLMVVLFISFAGVSAQAQQRGVAVTPDQIPIKAWGTYHALVIGINEYQQWPKLQTAVKDATVIRDTLIARYGFDENNVILRTDKEASRLQIMEDLRYLALSMSQHDNLLIYYAGHGQLDDLTGDGYWVPAEGKLKAPATWVANSHIKAVLSSERVKAKNVVVIADSCYSGSMLRGGPSLMSLKDRRYTQKLAEKASLRSRQVISSGGVEPVTDGGADGHSLFAYYLIDALRKNDREVIDLENLFHTQVWKKVTEIGDQRPNVGRLKTPMDQDGQFVLYNAAWIEERAQKQAASEAKKQEEAHQAAVAKAELDLQRQRIDMEKEKLAYEREQLSQQKALEMERLKIEKQKQAIEYAKLQARLKELEEKTKARQPAVKAEVAPETQLQASVDRTALRNQRVDKSGYRLAIFPFNLYTTSYGSHEIKDAEKKGITGIANTIADNEDLNLNYTYEELEGVTQGAVLLKDVLKTDSIRVWKKASLLSKSEPDWKEVRRIGMDLGANPIVMIEGDLEFGNYVFYLYDSEKDKIYSKKAKGNKFGFIGIAEVAARDLFRDFLKQR